jgi:LEA14-like dessication related protein
MNFVEYSLQLGAFGSHFNSEKIIFEKKHRQEFGLAPGFSAGGETDETIQFRKLTQTKFIYPNLLPGTNYIAIPMKKQVIYIIALFAASGIFSCTRPVAPEYLGFRELSFEKFSMDESLLHTRLAFYNSNPFSMQLKRADINVYLDDRLANHYVMDSTIYIPAKDSFLVPLSLRLNPKMLLGSAIRMLMNNNQVKIRLEGNVRVKRGGMGFNVPVRYEGEERLDVSF